MAKTIIDWMEEWAKREDGRVSFSEDEYRMALKGLRDVFDLCHKLTALDVAKIQRVKRAGADGDGEWVVTLK